MRDYTPTAWSLVGVSEKYPDRYLNYRNMESRNAPDNRGWFTRNPPLPAKWNNVMKWTHQETTMKKHLLKTVAGILTLALLGACSSALRRGMMGDTYISTARPAISLSVPGLPLLTAGRGMPSMTWTGVAGGLPIQVWLAVYGEGGLAPMAIVAQAQTPEGWYWNAATERPFSVNHGAEIFNGVTYQGFTYIVRPEMDPFANLYTAAQPDGQPQLWLARAYVARFNFNDDKIILEYREPLPESITTLEQLPYGHGDFLEKFRQRAATAFSVADCPANPQNVATGFANSIRWQYMDQNFLGNVSRNYNFLEY